MKVNASESQGQVLQNKKTTTKYSSFEDLKNSQEKVWKVEKKVEGGHSALMRLWINGEPTNQTAWGWEQNKNKFKGVIKKAIQEKFVPLQTKNTKVGRITSRI